LVQVILSALLFGLISRRLSLESLSPGPQPLHLAPEFGDAVHLDLWRRGRGAVSVAPYQPSLMLGPTDRATGS